MTWFALLDFFFFLRLLLSSISSPHFIDGDVVVVVAVVYFIIKIYYIQQYLRPMLSFNDATMFIVAICRGYTIFMLYFK